MNEIATVDNEKSTSMGSILFIVVGLLRTLHDIISCIQNIPQIQAFA